MASNLKVFCSKELNFFQKMMITNRPNESEWYEYVGEFVNLKLHDPSEFENELEYLKNNSDISQIWFDDFFQTINQLMETKYKIRHQTEMDYENQNSSDHVCLRSIIGKY